MTVLFSSLAQQVTRIGVVDAGESSPLQNIMKLVALASLIRAQQYEMALTILDNELGGGC